ncbi:hypothetical protein JCM19239_6815 [Vibrio variabilis]|uniref:Uncharacterized protein n=1 Tax=Vibrio variabilis TaxID=990271 RepID=A0ABQ0JN53_9VIBR|nr:hypothetical protein JCM19239_6815 [Vibrio variabilis]
MKKLILATTLAALLTGCGESYVEQKPDLAFEHAGRVSVELVLTKTFEISLEELKAEAQTYWDYQNNVLPKKMDQWQAEVDRIEKENEALRVAVEEDNQKARRDHHQRVEVAKAAADEANAPITEHNDAVKAELDAKLAEMEAENANHIAAIEAENKAFAESLANKSLERHDRQGHVAAGVAKKFLTGHARYDAAFLDRYLSAIGIAGVKFPELNTMTLISMK